MKKPEPVFDAFHGVTFKGAYPDIKTCPSSFALPIVAFTGRSNSGKSTLLSALCGHANLARSSKTAGKTRTLNYFLVPPGSIPGAGLYLVDMPGYGYAKLPLPEVNRLRRLIDEFLAKAENLRLIVLVLDARRGLGQEERGVLNFCKAYERRVILARTKWDTLNQKDRSVALRAWEKDGVSQISQPVSAKEGLGMSHIMEEIRSLLS